MSHFKKDKKPFEVLTAVPENSFYRTAVFGEIISGPSASEKSESALKFKNQSVLDSYFLNEVLGLGSFGKVRRGTNFKTERDVAIKVINKKRLGRLRGGVANIEREIRLQNMVKSPNVVDVLEVFRDEVKEKMYLVLELVKGGSLQSVLEEKRALDEKTALRYFRQIVSAAASIHDAGIVHRDIKPGNILLGCKGVLKLSDFGAAEKMSSNGTVKNHFKGTPSFLPPEHFSGPEYVDGSKVDIWAIGVTLYYMTTGRLPFRGKDIFELTRKIELGNVLIPPSLSDELQEMLRGLLEIFPERRFSLEDIKEHPWFRGVKRKKELAEKSVMLPPPRKLRTGRRYQKILKSF